MREIRRAGEVRRPEVSVGDMDMDVDILSKLQTGNKRMSQTYVIDPLLT